MKKTEKKRSRVCNFFTKVFFYKQHLCNNNKLKHHLVFGCLFFVSALFAKKKIRRELFLNKTAISLIPRYNNFILFQYSKNISRKF
jgi:hypothetical protein